MSDIDERIEGGGGEALGREGLSLSVCSLFVFLCVCKCVCVSERGWVGANVRAVEEKDIERSPNKNIFSKKSFCIQKWS